MQYFYSPSSASCYVDSVHGANVPVDCIKITVDEYHGIRNALSSNESYILKRDDDEILVTNSFPQLSLQEQLKQRITEIQQLLTANDSASVRPLRAKAAGTATDADKARLVELETQAQALRSELVTLTNPESSEDQSQPEQSSTKQSFLKKCNWLRMGKN
ncbi:hypothetical protein [Halodesulfovibrio aestuarii]|uniref:hypothetical protein n=1 Tax=Halodesulfovibrio aestuarii TaxID=126333 RepID=UPI00040F6B36